MKDDLLDALRHAVAAAATLGKWLALAVVTGALCGGVGTAFHLAVSYVTNLRALHPVVLLGLPVAGLAIVAFYKLVKAEGLGTNDIINAVQDGEALPLGLLPAIFVGTVLTHLTGGSAGREGAALQMGGTIGWQVGKAFRLSDHERRTATLCGMAAFFSALFGTPLAATLFAMMVINVGLVFYGTFVPCLVASLVAYSLSLALGIAPTRFTVAAPGWDAVTAIRVGILAVACALVAQLFCRTLHTAETVARRRIPNPYLRVLAGAAAVLAMTCLSGGMRYNGAGMDVIAAAVEQGQALPLDWLLKIVFTVLTLAAGYKGGEVVPCFFIGATFGCAFAPLVGLPAGFGAALGLIAVFCGASNSVVPSIVLAAELFGAQGLLYFAIVCGISYALSGYSGLYSSQTIPTDKLESEYRTPQHSGKLQPAQDSTE